MVCLHKWTLNRGSGERWWELGKDRFCHCVLVMPFKFWTTWNILHVFKRRRLKCRGGQQGQLSLLRACSLSIVVGGEWRGREPMGRWQEGAVGRIPVEEGVCLGNSVPSVPACVDDGPVVRGTGSLGRKGPLSTVCLASLLSLLPKLQPAPSYLPSPVPPFRISKGFISFFCCYCK